MVNIYENPNNPKGFSVDFPYSENNVTAIKRVLGFRWNPKLKRWVSEGPEVLLDMERLKIPIASLSPGARKIAEEFREQLWQTIDCRALPIDEEYAFQEQGSKYLSLMPMSILGDDMGLGKTKQSIDASYLVGAKNILVLCDKILLYNWVPELRRWKPEYTVGVVPDNQNDHIRRGSYEINIGRKTFWQNRPNMVVANYEKLAVKDWPWGLHWDVVICDEATRFKNSSTQLYKNVRRLLRNSTRAWALTGTPLEKKLEELYNILSLFRPAVLGNFMRFKSQHLQTDWSGGITGAKNLELLRARIAPFILRRTKTEVLKQLPPKLPPQNVFVQLSHDEEVAYETFKDDFGNWLAEHNVSGSGNALTQVLRMRQFCCTPMLFTDDLGKGSKFFALKDLLEQHEGQAVVFCFFRQVIDRLHTWLGCHPDAIISGEIKPHEAHRRIEAFNQGKLGKILVSTDAGQKGVNITGADLIVHYDQLFNAQKMNQREDRLHRIGQKNPVRVINLMCIDTVDYGTYLLNREEEKLFKDVIEGAEEYYLKKLNAARLKRLVEGKI